MYHAFILKSQDALFLLVILSSGVSMIQMNKPRFITGTLVVGKDRLEAASRRVHIIQ